jgi:hypothetical protein
VAREESKYRRPISWDSLDPGIQDTWFWIAKAVMAALGDLE